MDDIFENEGELPPPEATDASPLLYNRRIAAYEWGGGEIIFSPIAGFNKKGFLTHNLIALDQGHIRKNDSADDLRCLLAFLHEYRHYQQDLQTGIGHWDYVARTRHIINTLSFAKDFSGDGTAHEPLDPPMAHYIESTSECLLHREESREMELIRDTLARTEPNPEELAPLVTSRRMLEADAVLYVYMLLKRSQASKPTLAALKTLRHFYAFTEMPEEYAATLMLALRSFNNRVAEDIDDQQKLQNFLINIRMLLTMSLAHPDPDTLERLGHDKTDYLPGVRFIRLVNASIKQMLAVNERPRSMREFEASLIAKTGFSYPSYFDCEIGWAAYFKPTDEDPFPGLTEARRDTLARKYKPSDGVEEAVRQIYRDRSGGSVWSFLEYDLPLLMRRTDGVPQDILLTSRGIAKPEYNVDRLRHLLAWRLCEFIARRRPTFSCPLSKSPYCDARIERCRQPYEHLNDVPATDACRARKTTFDTNPESLNL
jgi:hypothetical protein